MKDVDPVKRSPVGSFVDRFRRQKTSGGDGETAMSATEPLVFVCTGCGEASGPDVEHGLEETRNVSTYFDRPCPHCGREQVALTSRRYT
jgi:hypothetical protein